MSDENHESQTDPSTDGHICLRKSQFFFIDRYRVNHGFKNRSEYIQHLVDHDIRFNRFDFLVEMMSMLILPMMGFFVFMIVAILTHGVLFYLFMSIFGIIAVFLCFIYYRKHRSMTNKKK